MDEEKFASEALQSKAQADLLDNIDTLRSQGISSHGGIPLPQLVVCGDQSSGKSSVLEAISRVSFPTNDGICTRFATEVVLRKSRETNASVKIQPGRLSSSEHQQRLQGFQKPNCRLAEVPQLIQEAKGFMGLSDASSSFSDDTLKIEISGPEQPHLTLVDLPGLFHAPKKEEDKLLVDNLVEAYMKSPRSIILVVISGQNDIENQIILQRAKELDKDRSRTMGIITKPDTIPPGSAKELAYLALARNEDIRFRLGWHILKNPNFHDRKQPDFDRDVSETVFLTETTPWNTLPAEWTGVRELRTRLRLVLMEQISAELPQVVREIEAGIETCRDSLIRLGPPRESVKDQREYLTKLSDKVSKVTKEAVDGQYRDNFFDAAKDKKLRSVTRDMLDQFAEHMTKRGHLQNILKDSETSPSNPKPDADPVSLPLPILRETYLRGLRPIIQESRGRELSGTFNPLLIGRVFLDQSVKWDLIASIYGNRLWNACKSFFELLMRHAAQDSTAEAILQNVIEPALESRKTHLLSKIDELLSPYRKGYPLTLNASFVRESQKLEEEINDKARAPSGARVGASSFGNPSSGPSLFGASNPRSEIPRSEEDLLTHACSQLLAGSQAYYKVAKNVFVDNFATLAIENCLLESLDAIFSPVAVAVMTESELHKFAAESSEVRVQREQATTRLSILEAGLESCKRHVKGRLPPARPSAVPALRDPTQSESGAVPVPPSSLHPRGDTDIRSTESKLLGNADGQTMDLPFRENSLTGTSHSSFAFNTPTTITSPQARSKNRNSEGVAPKSQDLSAPNRSQVNWFSSTPKSPLSENKASTSIFGRSSTTEAGANAGAFTGSGQATQDEKSSDSAIKLSKSNENPESDPQESDLSDTEGDDDEGHTAPPWTTAPESLTTSRNEKLPRPRR